MAITIPSGVTVDLTEYEATSTTPLTTAAATKTLTIQTGKAFRANDTITLTAVGAAIPTRLRGVVASYDTITGVLIMSFGTQWAEADVPSTTSVAIGTGAKSFVTSPGLGLTAGAVIRVTQLSGNGRWMVGAVTTYDNSTGDITLNVTSVASTGTYTDWTLISEGTFSNWLVTCNENDTYDVVGTGKLNITTTPVMPFGLFRALTRGSIAIKNNSTVSPIALTASRLRHGICMQVTQNGELTIEGNWLVLGTGTGVAGQAFSIPALIDRPTHIQLEVAAGSGIYLPWHSGHNGPVDSDGYLDPMLASDFLAGTELADVFLFSHTTRQLVCVNPVPAGCRVRIPTLHATSAQFDTYLSADVTAVAATLTINYAGPMQTTGEIQIGTERLTITGRTGQVCTVTRGQRNTTAAAWPKGTRVRLITQHAVSGNHQMPLIDGNPAGSVSIAAASFNFMRLTASNYADASVVDTGFLSASFSGTSAGAYLRRLTFAGDPRVQLNSTPLSFNQLSSDIDADYIYVLTDGLRGNQNLLTFTTISSIAKFDNYKAVAARPTNQTVLASFSVCAMKVDGDTFKGWTAVGGRVIISNSSRLRFEFPEAGANPSGANSLVGTDAFQFVNSNRCDIIGMSKLGGAHRNYVVAVDANSFDIRVYSPAYDMDNNTSGFLSGNGTNVEVYNGNIGRPRSISPMALNSASGKNIILRNVRGTLPLEARDNSGGFGYATGLKMDGITALGGYWRGTAGTTLPNYKDVGPFFTLFDDATAATGRVSIGSFSAQSALDMYTFSGPTAYLDNGGRLYLETAGDSVVIKSTEPLRSVTGFQNAPPIFEQGFALTGLVALNVTAPGSGLTTGAVYAVTGGSGTGGKVRLTGTTMNNAIWVGGEGYVAGDVISVGGGTSATITTMPTFEFKVSLPGGIAGAYWQAMTGANLAAAIPALGATYDPNDGFDMQVRIIANQTNVGAFLLQLRLQTNNLTTYRAKDTYFAITGCDLTDVVELRLVATDALVASRTGNGVLGFEGAPVFRKAAYLTRKTAGGDLLQTTISSPATLDVSNNGVVSLASFNIVVTGVGLADTIEMRNVADNTLRASRVGPGAFVILPADDGVAVYFERKVGGVLVMSTAFAPTTLQAGPNADVPLFVGAQVQVAQAPIIDTLPGKLDVLRRMVSKASKVIPTNEQFPA